MAVERYANNFATTLTTDVTSTTATSISVASVAPAALQSGQFRVIVDSELMLVTGGQSTTMWTVQRGVEGTTPATHSSGATVTHDLTQASALALGAVINVCSADYGAKGDGSTDDTAAINAAIDAAKAQYTLNGYHGYGAVVFFPPGVYICDSFLTGCQKAQGLVLQGAGTAYGSTGSANILFTGSAPLGSQFMDFRGATSVGIRDLVVAYTSTSFFGDLISFDWYGSGHLAASYNAGTDTTISMVDSSTLPASGSITISPGSVSNVVVTYTSNSANVLSGLTVTSGSGNLCPAGSWGVVNGSDVNLVEIKDCSFAGYNNTTNSANSLVRCNRSLGVHLSHTNFIYAQYGLQLGDGYGGYVEGATIDGQCQFAYNYVNHIHVEGSVQPLRVSGNVFEGCGPTSDQIGAIVAEAWGSVAGLTFEANWLGDNATPGAYIQLGGSGSFPANGNANGIRIVGNQVTGFTTGGATLTTTVNAGATSLVVSDTNFAKHFPASGGQAVLMPYPPQTPATCDIVAYTGVSGGNTLTGVTGVTGTYTASNAKVMPWSSLLKANGKLSGVEISGNDIGSLAMIVDNQDGSVYGADIAANQLQVCPLISSGTLNTSRVGAQANQGGTGTALPVYDTTGVPLVHTTGNYTVAATDQIVEVDSSGGAVTITLLGRGSAPCRPLYVKDAAGDAATNHITVQRAGADTIDGATTVVISTAYGSVTLYPGTAMWHVIS